MKVNEEIMEILEAFDLTQSIEAAARLAGCNPKTVARYVARRDRGNDPIVAVARDMVADPYRAKIEEWVDHSNGDIQADVCHRKLVAMGYEGSERTTRRAVASAKAAYERGHRRVYRPWVVEPGLWFQWDWGTGPSIWGRPTQLWCAWLAWSRFRVIIPTWDKTLPTVIACLDETLRAFKGVPTYALTDNEKTVTTGRVAGIALRHPDILAAARHYGCVIHTCQSADPESKGGVEATVRIAKADIVPTTANLRAAYDSFSELEGACQDAMDRFNAREHRETRRAPDDMIAEERLRLHPVPPTHTRSRSARPAPSIATRPSATAPPAIRCLTPWSARRCGRGSRATSSSSSMSRPPAPGRLPATSSPHRATHGSMTPTTPSGPPIR